MNTYRHRRSRIQNLRRLIVEPLEHRRLLTVEVEPNNTFASGTAISGNSDTLTGSISSLSDVDYFRATLQAGDSVDFRFSLNGEGLPSKDATLEIVDGNGVVIAAGMDAHSISYMASTAGVYALRLTANNLLGPYVGAYSVAATITPFAGVTESEANNSIATANALTGQSNFRGSLSSNSDTDYYSIVVGASQSIAVNFPDSPVRSPAVRIYSPAGSLLNTDRTGLGGVAIAPTTGTYYVAIGADNQAGDVTGSYVAQVNVGTSVTLETEGNNSFAAADLLTMGPHVVPGQYLSSTAGFTTQGLTGSYINQNLRGNAQTNWLGTQTVAGTRIDPEIHFAQSSWGQRSSVGLTGGTDANWDTFSVQWDGFIRIVAAGTQIYLASDDSSRMWIDVNGDGTFATSGSEFINNNWGVAQGNTLSAPSVALAPGDYRIRIQYEEAGVSNSAYLLWSDAARSSGAVSINSQRTAVGVLSDLSDIDVYALDLSATAFYVFELDDTSGSMGTQSRLLTLYNEYGQPLDYSHNGSLLTTGWNTRVEHSARYYITVQAVNDSGLGSYELVNRVSGEFPSYRDVPLYYQDYDSYTKQEQVDVFMAFFESRYDMYQVDLTRTRPATGTESVNWLFTNNADGTCGGSQGGSFGNRRPTGNGSGNCDSNWTRLSDVWFGLFYHENGHGVGMFHARHPLMTMSYGGQYDFLPIGSYNWMPQNGNGDPRVSGPRLFNSRDYLDWALESGRIVGESETNDSLVNAQYLSPYIASMSGDADARNDQVVIAAAISTIGDEDYYRLSVSANELYAFDIDSAEFQNPLDATLEILDSSGNVVASSAGGLDRDSGIVSVDPNLNYRFTTAGDYYVRVSGEKITTGYYRLKVAPERALDTTGPRIAGAWPDGGQSIDSTRQLTFWVNDNLDPATLTSANIVVRGTNTGVRTGAASFDPFTSTLTWLADVALPTDSYTVTFNGTVGGITDLRGNRLDGETDGSLNFPEVSGNGATGGNFVTTFTVTGVDTTTATISFMNYVRQNHDRDMLDIGFSDEMDVQHISNATYTLRGAGADGNFSTADDTFTPVDVFYDPMSHLTNRLLRVYTRGMLAPDNYRIEASLRDAVGNSVALSRTFMVAATVPTNALTTESGTAGLVGTYFNGSLRSRATQDDWRVSLIPAGSRTDSYLDFSTGNMGSRSEVGINGGTDTNWDDFSVQWDGFIDVPANNVRLFTRSDDGSRMWIDINNDGVFDTSGNEFINNNWGSSQGATTSPPSVALTAGRYRIRVQYEEGSGGNQISLQWDYGGGLTPNDGFYTSPKVVDINVQPNTVIDQPPASIDVTFSEPVNVASLTSSTFRLLYSPDESFFDGNDQYLTESDGTVAWDITRRKASFVPSEPLRTGYYLIELDGDTGGIRGLNGLLLDGEYRDANISGSNMRWNDAPSGDGLAGGDYRAMFIVSQPLVTLSIQGNTSIAEAVGTSTIIATLSYASTFDTTVVLTFSGSAESSDYVHGNAQFVIPAGSLTGSMTITAVQDQIDEENETIVVDILSILNATESNEQQVAISIIDDDAAPLVSLSADKTNVSEAGGIAIITATLSVLSERDVTVNLTSTGQAVVGDDYQLNSTTINIPAGSLTGSTNLVATSDALDEADESVAVQIVSAINADLSANRTVVLAIIDDDPLPAIQFALSLLTISEASGFTDFTATLATVSGRDVTVQLAYSGSASANDYTATGTLITIPAGSLSGSVRLTATPDSLDEFDELLLINVSSVTNAVEVLPQQFTAVIIDDDALPRVTLSSNLSTISENNGVAIITATISAPSALNISFDLGISGTASLTNDYTLSATQLTFTPGQTVRTIELRAVQDANYEGSELVTIFLRNLVNVSESQPQEVTVAITDDELPPQLTFTIDSATVQESVGDVRVYAELNRNSEVPIIVDFAFSGTASASDFTYTSNRLTIPAGQLTGEWLFSIVQDALDENNEELVFNVGSSQNVSVDTVTLPTFTIVDDDAVPTISFSVDKSQVSEAVDSAIITATLSAPSGRTVSGNLRLAGSASTGSDYQISATQLSIPAGSLTTTFTITSIQDNWDELAESIQVLFEGLTNAQVAASNLVEVNLVDDDPLPAADFSLAQTLVNESEVSISVVATLSSLSEYDVVVDFVLAGDATLGSDYDFETRLVIPKYTLSATQLISVHQDVIDELVETIGLSIGAISNATNASIPKTVSIIDDESLQLTLDRTQVVEGSSALLTVNRTGSNLTQPVVIALATVQTDEISLPTSITIPANQTNITLSINAIADGLLDGTQAVSIRATSAEFRDANIALDVTDNEALLVTIQASQISERSGSTTATVSRQNTNIDQPIDVYLSGPTSSLTFPSVVTIPAGQSTAQFLLEAIDDNLLNGNRDYTILASSAGYISAEDSVTVIDYEVLTFEFSTTTPLESAGSITARISRGNTVNTQALTVQMTSSDHSELVMPASVTIFPGQSFIEFVVTIVDDLQLDGPQQVMVTGTATQFIAAQTIITVGDEEPLTLSMPTTTLSERNGGINAVVTRGNQDVSQPLVVALFSSDVSEFTVPQSVTIAANRATATFEIRAVDDDLLDGPKIATVRAVAMGYAEAQRTVRIEDYESFSLVFDGSSIGERAETKTVTISRSVVDTSSALTVQLTTDSASNIQLPTTVVIPAGSSNATFVVTTIDNLVFDGHRSVQISARADGFVESTIGLTVLDDERLFGWHNARNRFDVDNNGVVNPRDALLIVNQLSSGKRGPLPLVVVDPEIYYDVSRDNNLSAIDALLVINEIRRNRAGLSEGEYVAIQPSVDSSAYDAEEARRRKLRDRVFADFDL